MTVIFLQNKTVKQEIDPKTKDLKSDLEKQIKYQLELRNAYEEEFADIKYQMSDIQSLIIEYKQRIEYLEELGGLYTN